MPRENRKRGKKHKKVGEAAPAPVPDPEPELESSAVVIDVQADLGDAPFGYVDPDLKSYFKSVDLKLREWSSPAADDESDQERRLFFSSALKELRGNELQLSTDPDCSAVVEGILYSMDAFALRVFLDSLSGSYLQLARHRFGSHVCQTAISVAASAPSELKTISDDTNGSPSLRTLQSLIRDCIKELSPHINELISDRFGTHVVRALIVAFSPSLADDQSGDEPASMRSKRSASWKKRRGEYRPLFQSQEQQSLSHVPISGSDDIIRSILDESTSALSGNEIRALAVNSVSSPTIQLLLRAEALIGRSECPDSILDAVLDGLATRPTQPEPSDFVRGLIRDTTASHLMECIIETGTSAVRTALWKEYFLGQLSKLAAHPVANFLVAKFLNHLSTDQISSSLDELLNALPKLIKEGRSGVVLALVARADALGELDGSKMTKALYASFTPPSNSEKRFVVYSMLGLRTSETRPQATVPGALLCQRLLDSTPLLNQPLVDSILSLPVEDVVAFSSDPIASRILDSFIDSQNVSHKIKRQFLLALIGQFHVMAQDRIGSRVVDRYWGFADLYMREKIARSVLDHERSILESNYGKYFTRHLNLPLLRKNPSEWKHWQRDSAARSTTVQTGPGKRKRMNEDG